MPIPTDMDPEGWKLLPQQAMFVAHYLGEANFDHGEAARLCGYANPQQAGADLLRRPSVAAAIAAKINQFGMGAPELLTRTAEIARGDIGDILSRRANGTWYVDLDKAHRMKKTHLIRKVKAGKYGLEAELYSATAAHEKFFRALGLYQDKVTINHQVQVDYSKLPPRPEIIDLLARRAGQEIDDFQLAESLRALGYSPSGEPLVIEGQGRIREVLTAESEDDGD